MSSRHRPSFLQLAFAASCPGCRRACPDVICPECLAALTPPTERSVPPGLRSLHALADYREPLPAIVLAAKNGHRSLLLRTLGAALAEIGPVDVPTAITWAPTTDRRRRHRGFDQAEVLARVVAGRARVPARKVLLREPGDAQCGRTAVERHDGPRFRALQPVEGTVWLVDDVCTTGSTLRAASLALLGAGAEAVDGLVVGRVALKPEQQDADTLLRAFATR